MLHILKTIKDYSVKNESRERTISGTAKAMKRIRTRQKNERRDISIEHRNQITALIF